MEGSDKNWAQFTEMQWFKTKLFSTEAKVPSSLTSTAQNTNGKFFQFLP